MSRQEVDVVRRAAISEGIAQVSEVMSRTLETASRMEEKDVRRCVLLNLDELDLLQRQVQLQPTGKRYGMFYHHLSVTRRGRRAAARLDRMLRDRISAVLEAARRIDMGLSEDNLEEPVKELMALHRHILWMRTEYSKRRYMIRGI